MSINPLEPVRLLNIPTRRFYVATKYKFVSASIVGILWLAVSIYLSYPWVEGLSQHIGLYFAWYTVIFIALIPGFLNMFLLLSLLLDRPPRLSFNHSFPAVSLLMAAYNEEKCIAETLRALRQQDYQGILEIIVVDDGSTDSTREIVLSSGMSNIKLILAEHGGKSAALNRGLKEVAYDYIISIDADTFLHPGAITRIMSRMLGDPPKTAAVAGCILVKNSRQSFMTRLQEWDYFLAISSVKRQQALYQGTLVAQGAFSLYKTEVVRKMNGWPASIGEDIVLTWAMIKAGYRIGFESTAVGFTEAPATFERFARQRRRWARGMIEGFKSHHELLYTNFSVRTMLIAQDLLFPIFDLTYTFIYIPGIILALTGRFWIAGPMTLAVVPLTLLISYVMYKHQRRVFSELGLKVRKNNLGFVVYTMCYQMLMSPVCVWGYAEEASGYTKKW